MRTYFISAVLITIRVSAWWRTVMNLQTRARLFLLRILLCTFLSRDVLAQTDGCPARSEDGMLCYLSTDCRGGVAPAAAISSAADCCGGLGLSFCDQRGCQNCFSEEIYTSSGSEFHLGFFNNLRLFQSLLSRANLRVQVTSDDTEPATVRVSYRDVQDTRTVMPGETVSFSVDKSLKASGIRERDRAVKIESVNGQRISVAGVSEEMTSSDSFCVLPPVFLPTLYEYYAVSVPETQLVSVSDEVVEDIEPEEKSALLIVTTADDTQLNITLTQTVSTDDAGDLRQLGPTINRGDTVSVTLDQDQTLYISSVSDLTGSRVVSDKPITFFSGHECGTIPQVFQYCDQLIEQIPPTATWGREFYTAPFLTRTGGDSFLVVASEDDTSFNRVCSDQEEVREVDSRIGLAGGVIRFNVSSNEVCRFQSDRPVLVTQFSLASGIDGNENADPFMVLVPPVEQYRSSLSFRVFGTMTTLSVSHFINIFLPAQFERSLVRLNGEALPENLWQSIPCSLSSESACAYAARMNVTADTQTVTHDDSNARIAVIVYSLGFRSGQGYSAGINQLPVTLDQVSLSSSTYSAPENEDNVTVLLERTGDMSQPTTVFLRSRTLNTDTAAQVGIDYSELSELVTFEPGQSAVAVNITLSPDDVFPEPDKMFDIFLSPSSGVFISPFAAATVSIINDDPDLPVLVVSIMEPFPRVLEGQGLLEVSLVKSEGAVGPVRVRLFTRDDTATADGDYRSLNTIITFSVDEFIKTERILILDDTSLENIENFIVSVEAINEEGDFPVVTINNTAIVQIEDNDVVVIGYNPVPCRTNEGGEGLNVQVGVLVGRLARNISVQFQTFSGTASAGEDFTAVSQTLVFSGSRRRFNVSVSITDDSFQEEMEAFRVQLSLSGQDSELSNIQIVQSEAVVYIADDDSAVIALSLTPEVPEGGVATATVASPEGQLGGEVRVRLSTISGNATAGIDFESLSNVVTLDQQAPSQSVNIQVFDNVEFEGNKMFSVVAELVSIGERVGITPSVAMTTIIENEQEPRVQCYLSENCGQNFFQLRSMRDCCVLLEAQSFSFPGDESQLCHSCIVVGFNMSEFVLLERNESYALTVGVRTGFLPQSITLELVAIPGTASAMDFVVPNTLTLQRIQASTNVMVTVPRELTNTDQDFESFRLDIVDSFGTAPSNMFFRGTVITIMDYEPVVQFRRAEYTATESIEGGVTVDIIVAPPPEISLQIELGLSGGSAEVGSDVQPQESPLYFLEPGTTSLSVNLFLVNDNVLEAEEQFSVTIVGVSAGAVVGALSAATVTILDDDRATIGFDRTAYTVRENETAVLLVEVLQSQLGRNVIVGLRFFAASGDTASALSATPPPTPSEGPPGNGPIFFLPRSSDFTPTTTSLTFNALTQQLTVPIPIVDDSLEEDQEFFSAELSLLSEANVFLSPGRVRVNIIDNDQPELTLRFEETRYVVTEGQQVEMVILFSSPASGQAAFTVRIVAQDETAVVGRDYVDPTEREYFIEPGQRSVRVVLETMDDSVYENTESLRVRISSTVGTVDPELGVAVIDITDNEELFVELASEVTPSEDRPEGLLFVSLSLPTEATVRATVFTTVNAIDVPPATSGVDFVSLNETIVFEPSEQRRRLALIAINDESVEDTELFSVNVTSNMPRVFARHLSTQGLRILDNDRVVIGFTPDAYSVSEGADGTNNVVVTLSVLSGRLETNVFVSVRIRNGSATFPGDVIAPDVAQVVFNNATTVQSISISIVDDLLFEGTEEFFVVAEQVLSERTSIIFDPPEASVRIEDNDTPSEVGFQQLSYNVTEEEEGGVELAIQLTTGSRVTDESVVVNIVLNNGTADVGRDLFPLQDSSVTFGPGATFQSVFIQSVFIRPRLDDIFEDTESFTVQLAVAFPPTVFVNEARSQATVNIIDLDTVLVEASINNVPENQSVAVVTLNKAGISAVSVNVSLSVLGTGAVFGATAGEDFEAITNLQVTFAPSETRQEVSVVILNDDRTEVTSESVLYSVTSANPRVRTSGEPGFFRIIDDDPAVVGFSPDSYTVMEGVNDVAQVRVIVVSGILGLNLPLLVRTPNLETNTATAGLDYTPLTQGATVLLSSEITEAFVNISITDDTGVEDMEAFTVDVILNLDADIDVDRTPGSATITILDNDSQLQVGFQMGSVTVSESSEVVQLFLTLSGADPETTVTADVAFINGTAEAGVDIFNQGIESVTLTGEGSTLFINIRLDTIYEADMESLTLRIVSVSRGSIDPERQEATLNIVDDDSLRIEGRIPNVNENEGEVIFEVSISQGRTSQIAVTVFLFVQQASFEAATPGEDFEPLSGVSLVFEPGEVTKQVPITIINDEHSETTEVVEYIITANMSRIETSVEPSFFRIIDDDITQIGFNPNNYRVPEFGIDGQSSSVQLIVQVLNGTLADGLTYSVRLTTQAYNRQDIPATVGIDFENTTTTLQFSSVATQQTVDVAIFQDEPIEGMEQFQAILTPLVDESPLQVVLDPSVAIITIFEPALP